MAHLEHPPDVLVEEASARQRNERADGAAGVGAVREEDEIGPASTALRALGTASGLPKTETESVIATPSNRFGAGAHKPAG
jgi:hypothetical protein